MEKLLVVTLLILSITLFAADRKLSQNQMRLTASINYLEIIPKDGKNSHRIGLMGKGADTTIAPGIASMGIVAFNNFTFLDMENSGISFSYGISDTMQLGISLPVFELSSGELESKQGLGPVKLSFLYTLNIKMIDITINPFVSIPFMQFNTYGDNNENYMFTHPFGAGISGAFEGDIKNIYWGGYLGFSKYFARKKEEGALEIEYGNAMFLSLSAMLGYQFVDKILIRLNLYYDFNNLENENIDPDISAFSFKLGADFSLTKNMELSTSFLFKKPIDFDNVTIGLLAAMSMKF